MAIEQLRAAVQMTPIIDHHAHNLLLSSELEAHSMLSITTEATGSAIDQTTSTLAHLRAVHQLANILNCEDSWSSVQAHLLAKRRLHDNSWEKYCFRGIETVLIDDGLDAETVHPYQWHDRLTRSGCKRIMRIEKVAENILNVLWNGYHRSSEGHMQVAHSRFFEHFISSFSDEIESAMKDEMVVGFKTVVCYRTGLALPDSVDRNAAASSLHAMLQCSDPKSKFNRLADDVLSPFLVHLTAELLTREHCIKPIQFHTGLGDNDILLRFSSSSHLQPFIEKYPSVPIVLLHASYPFTREAGYLASTYRNVYLDIGEVFPMVSQEGQENVIREALELCPSEKLMWSTDGHWYAETFLLATIQIRQGLEKVLCEYLSRQSLTLESAINIIHDILFSTSNVLYGLGLSLTPVENNDAIDYDACSRRESRSNANTTMLKNFLTQNPSIEYLRLQWLDYTTTTRQRIIPIGHACTMFEKEKCVGITKAVLGLTQRDEPCPGFIATGQYDLYPILDSLRKSDRVGHATVQCEFRDGGEFVAACPRTSLRTIVDKASSHGLTFLVGFEIEVVFMSCYIENNAQKYGTFPVTKGHCWSSSRAFHEEKVMDLMELIMTKLKHSDIDIQQFHAESAPGQFEFVMSPLAPVAAADALLAAREIIVSLAAKHGRLHATFLPRAYPEAPGTGAHVHFSLMPPDRHESFLAGILKHLPAIAAFTYPNDASYERVVDSVWAGGTWIAWGTQNRETPIRRIENSHYEVKCMDGLANPYFALGAILGAGVQGVLDSEVLTFKDCKDDPANLSGDDRAALGITSQFPKTFDAALDNLKNDTQLRSIMGESVYSTYSTVKTEESRMLKEMEPADRRAWLIERY